MKKIYGLQYDFVTQHSNDIVITRENMLQEKDLNATELKMLRNYSIPKLLPLSIEERDLHVTLRYNFTSKRQLAHRLSSSAAPISCIQWLYSVICIIDECKVYMLNPQRFVIHEDFIFIGSDDMDVHLLYLPICDLDEAVSLQNEMYRLAEKIIQRIPQMTNVQQMMKLLNYLRSETFSIAGMKQMLLSLMNEAWSEEVNGAPVFKPLSSLTSDPPSTSSSSSSSSVPSIKSGLLPHATTLGLILSIGIMCVVALNYPFIVALKACVGILLFSLSLYFWKRRKTASLETDELGMMMPNAGLVPINAEAMAQISQTDMSDYYSGLGEQTTFLSKPAATELLPAFAATELLVRPPKVTLEVNRGEQTEQIQLFGERFLIGRNPEEVQYVDSGVGVSRVHLEIVMNGEAYDVRDLGSKNGSFLNEERMIPHMEYRLRHGDQVKIAETVYIYKNLVSMDS